MNLNEISIILGKILIKNSKELFNIWIGLFLKEMHGSSIDFLEIWFNKSDISLD
jgi:hypothetical protein